MRSHSREKRESTFGAPKRLAGQPAHWHHQSIRAFALERGHRGATGTALPAGGGPRILAVPSDVMLGVRRAGVTEALHALESKGLIRSSRGAIVVRNRKGIERSAGGTYGVPEKELRRLVG